MLCSMQWMHIIRGGTVATKGFNDRKKQLRSLYKKYKVGLVSEEELTDDERFLLMKYYNLKEGGGIDET